MPGGKLTVITMAVDENGDFGYRPLLNALYSALLYMVDVGFLEREEIRRMVVPTYGRSRADFEAPFGPQRQFGSLRLEEMDVFYGEDHYWSDFERHGDAQAFASRWVAFSRASIFPTLAASLQGGRADARAAEFSERLETEATARLARNPERMRIPLAKILIAKKS